MEGERDMVAETARRTVHQLYQLFKAHPHEAQWTKKSQPLSKVRCVVTAQNTLKLEGVEADSC